MPVATTEEIYQILLEGSYDHPLKNSAVSFCQVEALALSPDGTLLATGARDKDIILSSLDVSLTEVDALPIEDQNEAAINYGATLWKKYTKKVMQKILTSMYRPLDLTFTS